MARHDARCVGTVAADSAALIWDASAPFFMFDRPFLALLQVATFFLA